MSFFYRKNEAVLLIKQNQDSKIITIDGVNTVMLEMLDFSSEDKLRDVNLNEILADEAIEYIEDTRDQEGAHFDIGNALSKYRRLAFKSKTGEKIPVKFKVMRTMSEDTSLAFRIIIQDEKHTLAIDQFKQVLADNFKGHEVLDKETNLPDRASMIKDLELAQHYKASKAVDSCFVYVLLDNYEDIENHGEGYGAQAILHVANLIKQQVRPDDVVARVSDNVVGVLLVDIAPDIVSIVINRLRMAIASSSDFDIDAPALKTLPVKFVYSMLSDVSVEEVLVKCKGAILQAEDSSSVTSV